MTRKFSLIQFQQQKLNIIIFISHLQGCSLFCFVSVEMSEVLNKNITKTDAKNKHLLSGLLMSVFKIREQFDISKSN